MIRRAGEAHLQGRGETFGEVVDFGVDFRVDFYSIRYIARREGFVFVSGFINLECGLFTSMHSP